LGIDADVRTTQLIAPGYRCPSNPLVDEVRDRIGEDFLFAPRVTVPGTFTTCPATAAGRSRGPNREGARHLYI
jgi:hypothetical protein